VVCEYDRATKRTRVSELLPGSNADQRRRVAGLGASANVTGKPSSGVQSFSRALAVDNQHNPCMEHVQATT
jgi:hypothetical protein